MRLLLSCAIGILDWSLTLVLFFLGLASQLGAEAGSSEQRRAARTRRLPQLDLPHGYLLVSTCQGIRLRQVVMLRRLEHVVRRLV